MIVYKLEWTTQKEGNISQVSTLFGYKPANQIELYIKQEIAEAKKKQLEDSAQVLGFLGLNAWITEIEIIE